MKYQVLAGINGPFLPDSYKVSDIFLFRKPPFSLQAKFSSEITDEQPLVDRGVNHRIRFNAKKPRFRKFSSEHCIEIILESESPHWAIEFAKLRIEQLVEALTVASFNVDKVHPRTGRRLLHGINDIYQYQIEGVFDEKGIPVDGADIEGTAINFFPEKFPTDFEQLANDILRCNDTTLIKAMFYLKRAKMFSYEYYSELEVFLNSMKCIELLVNRFYPHGLEKKDHKKASFKEKLNGFDSNPGVASILGIDSNYNSLTQDGWDCRNTMDMAHASEYFKLIAQPFPEEINRVAYYFVLKYVQYLKKNQPDDFWEMKDLDDEWWEMFR